MKNSNSYLWREFKQDFPREWKTNYRYQGLIPLMRCLVGTQRLLGLEKGDNQAAGALDCLTFTVIPEIARLWTTFLGNAFYKQDHNVILGDCSGNYPKTSVEQGYILPIFNFNHGIKLDLFMQKVCRSEYVLVCDDDIFWLDDEPFRYALKRFSENSNLAVVSLRPRPNNNIQLAYYTDQAMGSYCLIIRRRIWFKEGLLFKYHKPEGWKDLGNYFDTADYANLQLVQKGYLIDIASDEIRQHLVTFYGTSMWGIKILASRGEISKIINSTRPDEHKKVFRTALALEGFQDLLATFSNNGNHLISRKYLKKAELLAKKELDKQTAQEVEEDIYNKLDRMRALLQQQILEN